jgi:hypothetical protein
VYLGHILSIWGVAMTSSDDLQTELKNGITYNIIDNDLIHTCIKLCALDAIIEQVVVNRLLKCQCFGKLYVFIQDGGRDN